MSELWAKLGMDGARRDLELVRTYAAPPEDVWDAITSPERMARWIGVATIADGRYQLDMTPTDRVTGTVDVCDPPSALRVQWKEGGRPDSVLEVRLRAAGGGTELTVTHRGLPQIDAAGYGAGWHGLALALQAQLGDPSAERGTVPARYEALLPEYRRVEAALVAGELERVGLEEGAVGWVVRLERLLDAGLADVWAALTEPDRIGRWLWPVVSWPDDPARARPLQEGDEFLLGDENMPDGASPFAVLELVPRRLLVLRWGNMDTELRISLAAEPGATLLRLEQAAAQDVFAAGRMRSGPDFAAGWHSLLDGLALLLAEQPPADGEALWDAAYAVYSQERSGEPPAGAGRG